MWFVRCVCVVCEVCVWFVRSVCVCVWFVRFVRSVCGLYAICVVCVVCMVCVLCDGMTHATDSLALSHQFCGACVSAPGICWTHLGEVSMVMVLFQNHVSFPVGVARCGCYAVTLLAITWQRTMREMWIKRTLAGRSSNQMCSGFLHTKAFYVPYWVSIS